MNVVILVGKIAAPPSQRSDSAPVNLRVETREEFTNRDGEFKSYGSWHTVVLWGTGRPAAMKLAEGDLVEVHGALEHRSYEKDGNKVWVTEVKARGVQKLGEGGASRGQADDDDSNF
jgi:single-strand DNA-binding protein